MCELLRNFGCSAIPTQEDLGNVQPCCCEASADREESRLLNCPIFQQILQAYLPRMSAIASNSALSWMAEEPAGHSHPPWVSELCSTALRASRIPDSPFSQLLHARRALIRHELDNFFMERKPIGPTFYNRPTADGFRGSAELPSTVVLGLTTFNVVLKSLCKERHDLEVEVTSAVCTVLQGLPRLTELSESEAAVLDSLEQLLIDLVDSPISRDVLCEGDARRIGGSLRALFLLSLLRCSLSSVARAALLTFRAEEALAAAGCRADVIKMDISGPHLEALKELCEGGDFGDDLSPLSDGCTLLDDFHTGARLTGYSSIATDGCYLYTHTINVRATPKPKLAVVLTSRVFDFEKGALQLTCGCLILAGYLQAGLWVRIRSKQALPGRPCTFWRTWVAHPRASHRGLCTGLASLHAPGRV